MRAMIFSDIHIYDPVLPFELPSPSLYDVALFAGDLSNGRPDLILWLHELFKDIGKPLIFICGNHDYYNRNIKDVNDWLLSKGVYLLTEGITQTVGDITFVGGTGFSNFQLYTNDPIEVDEYKLLAHAGITDFKKIHINGNLVTPSDYVTMFNKEWNWIQQFRNREDVVVMTHFPLSIECLDPLYANDSSLKLLNPYFINNVDLSGFKTIISGHTHQCIDKVITNKDNSQTHYVINALGYKGEYNNYENGFDLYKFVEL